MMGQKCPIKKTPRDKDDRSFRTPSKAKAERNTGNRQQRIRELVRDKQGAAAIGLYSFFAEHIDPTCGAVVCDQQFLANQMGVSTEQFVVG